MRIENLSDLENLQLSFSDLNRDHVISGQVLDDLTWVQKACNFGSLLNGANEVEEIKEQRDELEIALIDLIELLTIIGKNENLADLKFEMKNNISAFDTLDTVLYCLKDKSTVIKNFNAWLKSK